MIDPRDLARRPTSRSRSRPWTWGRRHARRLLSAILGRGIHDPAVWGHSLQIPVRLAGAVGRLPRLALEASRGLVPRRLPEAPLPHS